MSFLINVVCLGGLWEIRTFIPGLLQILYASVSTSAVSVTENPGIKPRNANVVLKGRHSLLQHWMHGG